MLSTLETIMIARLIIELLGFAPGLLAEISSAMAELHSSDTTGQKIDEAGNHTNFSAPCAGTATPYTVLRESQIRVISKDRPGASIDALAVIAVIGVVPVISVMKLVTAIVEADATDAPTVLDTFDPFASVITPAVVVE